MTHPARSDVATPERPGCADRPADSDLRHEVYVALLDALPLSDRHKADLLGRGLPAAAIEAGRYRTLQRGCTVLVAALLQRFSRNDLLAVPGFYTDKVHGLQFQTYGRGGLLIPARDAGGRLAYLKLRADREHLKPRADGGQPSKYLTVSSAKRGGSRTEVTACLPPGLSGPVEVVWLTEGELKAHVATVLGGMPVLSVPGVALWQKALPALEFLRTRVVVLAFDADAETNPGVGRALAKAFVAFRDCGYEVRVATWPASEGKGIDDLLLGGGTPALHEGPAAEKEAKRIVAASGAEWPRDFSPAELSEVRKSCGTARREASPERRAFDDAKRAVDLPALLTEWFGPPKGTGGGRRWKSPWAGDRHSLVVTVPSGGVPTWHCWVSGNRGDCIELLCQMGGYTFRRACESLRLPVYKGGGTAGEPTIDWSTIDTSEPAGCRSSSRCEKKEEGTPRPKPTFRRPPRCPRVPGFILERLDDPTKGMFLDGRCKQRNCPFCGPIWEAIKIDRFEANASRHSGPLYLLPYEPSEWKAVWARIAGRIRKAVKAAAAAAAGEESTTALPQVRASGQSQTGHTSPEPGPAGLGYVEREPGKSPGQSHHGYANICYADPEDGSDRAFVIATVPPADGCPTIDFVGAFERWRQAVKLVPLDANDAVTFHRSWSDEKSEQKFVNRGPIDYEPEAYDRAARSWGLSVKPGSVGKGVRKVPVTFYDSRGVPFELTTRELSHFSSEVEALKWSAGCPDEPELFFLLLHRYHNAVRAGRPPYFRIRNGVRVFTIPFATACRPDSEPLG